MLLVAGLSTDSLGELERSPRLLSRNRGRGPTSVGKGEGRGGQKMEGRVRGKVASSLFNFWLRACLLQKLLRLSFIELTHTNRKAKDAWSAKVLPEKSQRTVGPPPSARKKSWHHLFQQVVLDGPEPRPAGN